LPLFTKTCSWGSVLHDPKLSWKAKGIFLYIFENEGAKAIQMLDKAKNGRDSLTAGINELIDAGYLERRRRKGHE
jgi:DNA-binding MarR family transcriptional regulator